MEVGPRVGGRLNKTVHYWQKKKSDKYWGREEIGHYKSNDGLQRGREKNCEVLWK